MHILLSVFGIDKHGKALIFLFNYSLVLEHTMVFRFALLEQQSTVVNSHLRDVISGDSSARVDRTEQS